MEISITQVTVLVADMDRAVHFYRDILGLTAINVSEHWSEFEAGPIHIALHPGRADAGASFEAGSDAGTVNIVFTVPDLEATCDNLRQRGVAVDGPHALEGLPPMATFSDPDRVSFTLM